MAIKVGAASAKATADAYYSTTNADGVQAARDDVQNKIRLNSKNGKYSAEFSKTEYPKIFEAYVTLKAELENAGYEVTVQGEAIIVSWG